MKSFFENYGFTILASIVVILLITMASPISSLIRNNISNIIEGFGDKTSQRLNDAMRELQPKDIIEVAGKKLTIMKNLGKDKFLVLADNAKKGQYNNNNNNHNYDNSIVDNYLENEYFNKLPLTIKNAIIPQIITQTMYDSSYDLKNEKESDYRYQQDQSCPNEGWCWTIPVNGEDKYYWGKTNGKENWQIYNAILGKPGSVTFKGTIKDINQIGERKVFLPSVVEIRNIVNYNDSKEMEDFLLSKTNPYYMWLRDGYGKVSVLSMHAAGRSLDNNGVDLDFLTIRPSFVIDLSKVSYTVK